MGSMPMGMPTSGFAPPAVPPNMIAGGPQWGMPITGTPIGLPGPPHMPLGIPAGLQKHVMKNRTKTMIPPPVTKMHMSVKATAGPQLSAAGESRARRRNAARAVPAAAGLDDGRVSSWRRPRWKQLRTLSTVICRSERSGVREEDFRSR